MLTQDQLQFIREEDAYIGQGGEEALQMWPRAYTHRRQLLTHIAEQQALVSELSTLLEPFSGGAQTLDEIVVRLRMAREIRSAMEVELNQQSGGE